MDYAPECIYCWDAAPTLPAHYKWTTAKRLKAMGIKSYAKLRKSGLVDVLGKDNGKSFAVGKKGEANGRWWDPWWEEGRSGSHNT
jgi:hypothetical protein